MRKKLLSVVLALAMVLSWLPAALAVSAPGDDGGITNAGQFVAALGGAGNVSQSFEQWHPEDFTPFIQLPVLSLNQDITIEANLRVKKSFILDLNGHTLDMGSYALISDVDSADDGARLIVRSSRDGGKITGSCQNGILQAEHQGYLELTLSNAGYGFTITGTGNNTTGIAAKDTSEVTLFHAVIENTDHGIVVLDDAELTVYYGSNIKSTGSAITTNYTEGPASGSPEINISGGTIESETGAGIYLTASDGVTHIDSGTIKGKTGVEIRAGKLDLGAVVDEDIVIEGSSSGGAQMAGTVSGPGPVTENAGIAVIPYGTDDQKIGVTIAGGTISGSAALYCGVPTGAEAAGVEFELAITSGVFKGGSGDKTAGYGPVVVTENAKARLTDRKFIAGGTFSGGVFPDAASNEFLADGKTIVEQDDNTYMVIEEGESSQQEDSVAQVGPKYYDSLKGAIEAAYAGIGDTVKLLTDIDAAESCGYAPFVDITKPLTLDLAGCTLDLGTDYSIQVRHGAGHVIIQDTGGRKGKITSSGFFAPIDVEGSSLTLSGVTVEYKPVDGFMAAIGLDYASVSIENGSKVIADAGEGEYVKGVDVGLCSELTVNGGTIQVTGRESEAIDISGVDMDFDTTSVNITNGTIKSENSCAIYNSRHSNITVNSGTITGLAGIVAHSGQIEVKGGTIEATGTKGVDNGYGDYEIAPAGIVFDESFHLPVGEDARVTITGGKVVGANGQPSLVYTKNGIPSTDTGSVPFTIAKGTYFLSGGKGDKYVKGYLADGLTINETTGEVIEDESSSPDGVYTITFDAAGGKFTDDSKTKEVKTNNKGILDKSKLPANPTRDNYTFDDWYTGATVGEKINFAYAFTKDTTVYAHWTEDDVKEVTVTFDANGGTVSPTSATTKGGKLDTLPTPTRAGYTFDAWYTAKEGGTKITTDTKFTVDTTIYAHWKDASSKDPNDPNNPGGSGSDNTAYAIKIASGIRHGKISTSHTSAEQGTWVTLTVSPDADYALDWVEVEREDGQRVSLSQEGRRYSFAMPASNVTVNAKFSFLAEYNAFIPPQTKPQSQASDQQTSLSTLVFTPITWRPAAALWDLPTSSWAYPAAQWAYQNGYLDTAIDGTFRLSDTVSHIQMWKIMARWLGESTLDDISVSQWARKNGASNTGSASAAMTRQNMVEYLYRCYYLMGGDVSVSGDLLQYLDGQQVMSTSARNAWIWAVNKGIITGTTDGRLNPSRVLNRGEFAAILMRLCQKG